MQTLFSRTVGPVKEVLMVYNSQGKSRGMAVVAFARPGDAAVARAKYNGKIVDGSEYPHLFYGAKGGSADGAVVKCHDEARHEFALPTFPEFHPRGAEYSR